ncbi:hypothetical protein J1614_010405 [Plenodomus biglobosus]|nr:hypothetical protein J1614_010405 [Plenodomus biglobosus]
MSQNRAAPPIRRTPRAHSIISPSAIPISSYAALLASHTPTSTRHSTPQPRTRASSGLTNADPSGLTTAAKPSVSNLPSYWALAPTVPSPFAGTLEASLDAILAWGKVWAVWHGVQRIVDTMLGGVNKGTDWSDEVMGVLFQTSFSAAAAAAACSASTGAATTTATARPTVDDGASGRIVCEELLFLVTRTLLPEQIKESRDAMARLYERRKHLAIRLLLRYDMLLAWKTNCKGKDHRAHPVVVNCVASPGVRGPARISAQSGPRENGDADDDVDMSDLGSVPLRRPLMANVWPTLLLPPPTHPNGFATHGVRERMRHHVTDLDPVLMYTDEEVAKWSDQVLVARTGSALLLWQWMRRNNEILEDMEVNDWEDLDGKAEECDWIAD